MVIISDFAGLYRYSVLDQNWRQYFGIYGTAAGVTSTMLKWEMAYKV